MKTIKNKIKAVIFDMDGTIIKTEEVWHKVTTDVLALNGFGKLTPNQEKLLLSFSGIGLPKACSVLKEEFNLKKSVDELIDQKMKLAKEYFEKELEFIEGFAQFHKKLQEHQIPTSIATNADKVTLYNMNKKMNLQTFFGKNMYCLDHVENKAKPDPAIFLHAIKQLNVKPEECIIFEDSLFGFQAAKAAGVRCVAIKNSLNDQHRHLVEDSIDNYHQAEEILKKLTS